MAKIGKWIGGFLGFIVTGSPLGALAGYALGSLFDSNFDDVSIGGGGNFGANNGYRDGYGNQQYGYQQSNSYEGQRNAFRFSLLVLASYIINADGRIMHSEMNLVRQWLRANFGEAAVSDGEQVLRKLFEQQKNLGRDEYRSAVMSSCQQIRQNMSYEQRLQLLNFLVMIAQADGAVVNAEVSALMECAINLGLSEQDVNSMLNLRDAGTSLDAAYRVLGVSPQASDKEVKAAYRKLALQHHPDRVSTLGEDVRKAAEKKFQEINAAKETIWKARGL
ncbi:MAG: DnaJ domain-containing protein [Prevotella sp.]|nr:DnaJ domain-containing protein [Prevotella sp.]